jgi:hypothetical protein
MSQQFFGGATTLRFAPVSVDSLAPARLALRAAFGSLPSGFPRRLVVPLHQTLELPLPRSAIALVFLSHSAWWTRMSTLREPVFGLTRIPFDGCLIRRLQDA